MDFNRLTGEFANPDTERAFLDYKLDETRRQLGITLLGAGLFFMMFFATDLFAVESSTALVILFCARLTVALGACGGAWFVLGRFPSVHVLHSIAAAFETLALGCFMVVVALRPSEFHWHVTSIVVMLTICYLYIPNRMIHSLSLAFAATAIFLAFSSRLNSFSGADMVTMVMLLAMTNVIGVLAVRRHGMVARQEFCLHRVLKAAAEHDHLTGCYNRRHMHEQLLSGTRAWARGHARHVTVLLCDIDHFKRINDTHGHANGDAVLRAFGGLLCRHAGARGGSAVRYGGEEFLAVLPDTDLDAGMLITETLRRAFAIQTMPSGAGTAGLRATASFGLVVIDTAQADCKMVDLIAAADEMMYRAKANGRNRVEALRYT